MTKMMYRFLFLIFFAQRALAGFFEFSEVDDPLQSLWQNEKLEKKLTECRVLTKSGVKYGSCVPYGTCMLSGGAANGFCGILQTCCIYENTCGKESDTKVGYFEANEVTDGVTTCNYVIKLRNPNICQVRLDFVKFNLAPATMTLPQYATRQIYKCNDDRLKIVPNYFGIPELCGNNDKQHVYVHVNQTDGVTKGVQLQVTLADRNYNPHLPTASWKIKITQLQCPGEQKGFHLPKLDADQDVIQDFPQLAPLGTIQYFTEKTGYFRSFGFDGSIQKQQSYTYGQNYAIGFKRDINICGIQFTPDYINLPFDNYVRIYSDRDCKHYLYVPELYFEDQLTTLNSLVSKVCIRSAAPFKSYAPGPFYVNFNSMMTNFTTDTVDQKQGFNIKYELLTKCT
ncbi:unnamed protein product [Phaedon cochleariae]|uniref:CUB domain-containing protein n=1 Tax=Phaedon cochleariae TaxID=80249 RepID=A0A9P0GKB7_PHACE|nr:unnamed protein product [Phaedon cochleariae]